MKKDNFFTRLLLLSIILISFLFLGKTTIAQITTYPYQQGWESNSIDDWSQVAYDDENWTSNSGTTSSTSTGPTGANEGTYYIYCETSGSSNGDDFVLESPEFDFSSLSNPQFAFDYHMYFSNYSDGTLNVDISTNLGTSWTTIHTITGHQQSAYSDSWLTDTISLLSYAGESSVMFRFFFTTGLGTAYQYDMCIDYVQVLEGPALLAIDAGIADITSPTGNVAAGNSIPVHATIKNFGTTTLTTADMCFSVNGGATQSTTWNGNLAQNTVDVNVYIDDAVFSGGVNSLKVWTESPNGLGDMQSSNDTIQISITGEVPLSGVYTVGSIGADFNSFTNPGGVFETVNSTVVAGDLIFEVISDITTETGTHALNQWNESGVGNYTMTIRPDGNTERLIEGDYQGTGYSDEGLYRLDSVSRVIIDGRDPNNLSAGGRYLLFRNIQEHDVSHPAYYYRSTFNFLNGSHNDTLRNVIIEANTEDVGAGIIRFGRYQKGSYNILIDSCYIRSLTSDPTEHVRTGIYSYGVSSSETNHNITISNNHFINIWDDNGNDNHGIYITGYSSDFTITGNHFYWDATRDLDANVSNFGIYVNTEAYGVGDNFIINNNYLGGSAPYCGGSAWSYSSGNHNSRYIGIKLETKDNSSGCIIENNKINNFEWYQYGYDDTPEENLVIFCGIQNGSGNSIIRNNIIGAPEGTDSISLYCGPVSPSSGDDPIKFHGIWVNKGNVTIDNNSIGAIKSYPSAFGTDKSPFQIEGIHISELDLDGNDNTGDVVIKNNLIGSLNTANSIETTAPSKISIEPRVIGIYLGSHGLNIADSNIIANMHNGNDYYDDAQTIGIYTPYDGQKHITNNKIFNLTSTCYDPGSGYTATIVGIRYQSNTNTVDSIVGNEIYNLKNLVASDDVGVCGIGVTATSSTNQQVIARNNIHSLSLESNDNGSTIIGIYFYASGLKFHNNFIRLGIDADGNPITEDYEIIGINQASNNCDVNYNTVYIGGNVNNGVNSTSAFQRTYGTVATDLYNNIFINERSNNGGTASQYAVFLEDNATINSNYNLLWVNGTNGVIGKLIATDYASLGDWQAAISDDANSISGDVNFVDDIGPASSVDLHIDISLPTIIESAGTVLASISDDIDLEIRYGAPGSISSGTAPDIGADEINFSPLPISLLDFSASCLDKTTVLIRWTTASETNNAYFTIERSLDGVLWSEIAQVSGAGNSNQVKSYEYICTSSKEYPEYYRLKQTDYNGSYEYFKPITISCTTNEEAIFEIYPNPFKDNFTIFYSNGADETAIISIFDAFGKLVYLEQANEIVHKVSVEDFAKGCYIVQFRTNNFTKTVKLIKQ